jgi:hypothetical protein
MPSVTNNGGSIESNLDPANVAGVVSATATQTGANTSTWVVTLTAPPQKANYARGNHLTYNAIGTHNPNANNALVVTSVNGPAKYTCSGPWPMNT